MQVTVYNVYGLQYTQVTVYAGDSWSVGSCKQVPCVLCTGDSGSGETVVPKRLS